MDDAIHKDVREHAWAWFALHAAQRMQTINFFIVIEAAMLAGAAAAIKEKLFVFSMAAGVSITALAIFFCLMERRVRNLIRIGEAALRKEQSRLALRSGISEILLLEKDDESAKKQMTYGKVFLWMFGFFMVLGLVIAASSIALNIGNRPPPSSLVPTAIYN